jgi:hypothetical protein
VTYGAGYSNISCPINKGVCMSTIVVNKDIGIGSKVKLIKASYGWGSAKENDTGVVVNKEIDSTYAVVLDKNGLTTLCAMEDMVLVDKDTIAPLDSVKREIVLKYIAQQRDTIKFIDDERSNILKEMDKLYETSEVLHRKLSSIDTLRKSRVAKVRSVSTFDNATSYLDVLIPSRYASIVIHGLKISAVTNPITIRYHSREEGYKEIALGKYEVIICVGVPDDIIVHSVDNMNKPYDHPHIRGGHCCWGTWYNQIAELMANCDYLRALQMIYSYLSSYDNQGWYTHVLNWADDRDERCDSCYMLQCICEKEETCNNCGYTFDVCECLRCPSSNEVINEYDDYCFNQCRHWDSVDHSCTY